MKHLIAKQAIFSNLRAVFEDMAGLDDSELNRNLFFHHAGLRLSYTGYLKFAKVYTSYEFPIIDKKQVSARHLISLTREMGYPYYISAANLVLFSEQDAFMFKLRGGTGFWIQSPVK
jgi:hypothetical protein